MRNETRMTILAVWTVVATVATIGCIYLLVTGKQTQKAETQARVTQAVKATKASISKNQVATSSHVQSSSNSAAPVSSSTSSSTASSTATASADAQSGLATKAEQFVKLNATFNADQRAKHDELLALSNQTIADKLVPDQSVITNKALLETDSYKITWKTCQPLMQPNASGDSGTVVVKTQYNQANDTMSSSQDMLVSLTFKDGRITAYQIYQVKQSQS